MHYANEWRTKSTRRILIVCSVMRAADLLLQGCQLTQYTEGYTATLLEFARKVLGILVELESYDNPGPPLCIANDAS